MICDGIFVKLPLFRGFTLLIVRIYIFAISISLHVLCRFRRNSLALYLALYSVDYLIYTIDFMYCSLGENIVLIGNRRYI